mgnify:CR=1 FL=1
MYKLLGDKKYLTMSYEKVQEELNKVEDDLKEVYLDYPIEKQIIAEYKKIVGGETKFYIVSLPIPRLPLIFSPPAGTL